MRSLVRKKISSHINHHPSDGGDTLYKPTEASTWLLHGSQFTRAPMVIMENHLWQLAGWHYLTASAREGGIAFEKAHGCEMWGLTSKNVEFNNIFDDALACATKFIMEAIISEYNDGFNNIGSLVDVGSGTGGAIAEIVKSYPHIKGINFDLPLVITTANQHPGVTHVGGHTCLSSFQGLMLFFSSGFCMIGSDEQCVKILEKSKEAVAGKKGKIIIMKIVLKEEGGGVFDKTRMAFDMFMMARTML